MSGGTDPLTLAGLSATALTEGIKFLYGQADDLLRRRRDGHGGRHGGAPEQTDADLVQRFEPDLRALMADLEPYLPGPDPALLADPRDERLLRSAEALRQVLGAIRGAPVVLSGEPPTAVRGTVNVEEVAGYVAAVRAHRVRGRVEGHVEAGRVERGGEVVGVELDSWS